MPEITREYIEDKRHAILSQMDALNGALELLKVIEDELINGAPMTMDELKRSVGAVEIGQPQEVG